MKVKDSIYDVIVNVVCIVMLVLVTAFLVITWENIPYRVQIHSNFMGEVDRWGSKYEILMLPIISWVLYIVITVIQRFPGVWNTGIKVTQENKDRVYRTLKNMITTLKFILISMFSYLTIETALTLGQSKWFLPVAMTILFGNVFFWIWKLVRIR